MAVLIASLAALRATFNRHCPARDKTSDGWIGDAAHRASSSDHNPDETGTVPIRDADSIDEVHAIDVDEDLRAVDARGPFTMMRAVRQLVTDCRAGREQRLRYIIYERTIWSASWGWTAREYTGANPHDKHAHFSGSYDSAKERDTSPWNIGWIEEADVDLTAENLRQIGQACWAFKPADHGGKTAHAIVLNEQTAAVAGIAAFVAAAEAREAARDAAQTELIRQVLAAAGTPLSAEQFDALLQEMRAAAEVAGAQATTRVQEQLAQLRTSLAAGAQAAADVLKA